MQERIRKIIQLLLIMPLPEEMLLTEEIKNNAIYFYAIHALEDSFSFASITKLI